MESYKMDTVTGWRWRWCVVAVVVMFFVSPGRSAAGATCWSCNYDDSDEACKGGQSYIPMHAVTNQFCRSVRNSEEAVAALCETYPNGYKLVCERPIEPKVITCRKRLCPVEPASQTGHDVSSQMAPSFLLLAASLLTLLWIRVLQ